MNKSDLNKKILTYFSELFINIEIIKEQKNNNEEGNRIKNFKSAREFIEKYKNDKKNKIEPNFDNDAISKIMLKCSMESTVYRNYKTDFNRVFAKFYKLSETENYFWHNCSIKIYKSNFINFKESYLNIFSTKDYISFLEHEINYYDKIIRSSQEVIYEKFIPDYLLNLEYMHFLNPENKVKMHHNRRDKLNFLKLKAKDEGYVPDNKKGTITLKKIDDLHFSINKIHTEKPLTIKDIPEFDLLDRFELIKELGMDNLIYNLKTSQRSKYKVLALIMGIHPDNARKIMTQKYPKLKSKERIQELCSEAKNNVSLFLTNPLNDIKIP